MPEQRWGCHRGTPTCAYTKLFQPTQPVMFPVHSQYTEGVAVG